MASILSRAAWSHARTANTMRAFGSKGPSQYMDRTAAKGGKKGAPADGATASREKSLEELLRPIVPPPKKSLEERQKLSALMIEYGKMKRRHHIENKIKQQEFLRVKWSAIDALPHHRKVEALETKPTEFPLNRPLPTDTPPIKGFNKGDLVKPVEQRS